MPVWGKKDPVRGVNFFFGILLLLFLGGGLIFLAIVLHQIGK
jgi:hypothetical protein